MGRRFPLLLYLGTIMLMTVIFTGGLLSRAYSGEVNGWFLALVGPCRFCAQVICQ
jgi:hypothetical protein